MILSGTLLTPTGEPYKNSSVRITANNTSAGVLMFVQKDFKTDEDGEYEIDVPNGWYKVSIFSLEYRSYVNIGNIEVTDATTETTINALLMIGQTASSDPLVQVVIDNAASALVSKNAATISASQSATSASSAAVSTTNAQNSATASATSATSSQASAANSQASATASASSASASASSASSANTSANSASSGATTATTKAAEASTSAQNALNSANAADTSATLTASLLSTKENTITVGTSSQYWRGDKTFQTLDKSAVGLPNVDNTADSSKPVSTAQQTALNAKLNLAGGTLSGALNEAPYVTIASASTTNIGGAAGNTILITGTTTITAFGTAPLGATREVVFGGVLTLTHNPSSLILGGANLVTASNDTAKFFSLGSGNWQIMRYNKANGQALVGSPQVGIASAAASADDVPLYNGVGGFAANPINSTTRVQFHLIQLDSPLTFTDIVIAVRSATAATSVDIGIYNFLGAGKPGACVASANFATTATGRVAVTVGSAVTMSPGLYFVALHGNSTSPTLATYSQTTDKVPGQLSGLAISDAMTQISAGTTTLGAVLINDSALPGGSYSRGMNMTGLTMSSGNIVGYNTSGPVVALKKQ